jgi:hypothetical protein
MSSVTKEGLTGDKDCEPVGSDASEIKEVDPMKRALLALAMIAIATGTVLADEHDLSSAVLICHRPADLVFSAGEEWCARYDDTYSISNLSEANPTVSIGDGTSANKTAWYVIAAFCDGEEKLWSGVQFGFGDYSAELFYFSAAVPCHPDPLEILEGEWPGPNTGIAIVSREGSRWEGNYEPIYYFEGYQYVGSGIIPIGDYADGQGIEFGNTLVPTGTFLIDDPTHIGSMGILTDGVNPVCGEEDPAACCDLDAATCTLMLAAECAAAAGEHYPAVDTCDPNPCEDVCCDPNNFECTIATVAFCDAVGGDFMPEYDDCDENPCLPQAICCANGGCSVITEAGCDALSGNWYADELDCGATPCFVCCVDDACSVTLSDDCATLGGNWHGPNNDEWNSCSQPGDINPCETPIDVPSWGSIKTIYNK